MTIEPTGPVGTIVIEPTDPVGTVVTIVLEYSYGNIRILLTNSFFCP